MTTDFNYRTIEAVNNGVPSKAYAEKRAEFEKRGIPFDEVMTGDVVTGIKRATVAVNLPTLNLEDLDESSAVFVQSLVNRAVYDAAKVIVDSGENVDVRVSEINFPYLVAEAARKAAASGGSAKVKVDPEVLKLAIEAFKAYLKEQGKPQKGIDIQAKGLATKFGQGFCNSMVEERYVTAMLLNLSNWFEDLEEDEQEVFACVLEASQANVDRWIKANEEAEDMDEMF